MITGTVPTNFQYSWNQWKKKWHVPEYNAILFTSFICSSQWAVIMVAHLLGAGTNKWNKWNKCNSITFSCISFVFLIDCKYTECLFVEYL